MSYQRGFVQCFCDARAKEGDEFDKEYMYSGAPHNVCEDYFTSLSTAMIVSNGVMVAIIAINFILK